ncbi:ABC transporter ATP-binding protein [Chloroflexota bacterium]
MTVIPQIAEFSLPQKFRTNRSDALRWISSHALRHWWLGIVMVVGAFGNAAMASAMPILIGQAFNAVLETPPDTSALLRITLLIVATQLIRGVLQFGRNFGAELIGQRMERDIRHELYVSLLGKSMTFHSLQPVGDTMARATNDVREINLMFSPGINLVVGSALFMFMPLVLAPQIYPTLIIIPIIFVFTYYLALWQYLHELNPVTSRVRDAFGKLNTRLAEVIDGIETVKAMAQEHREVERFMSAARKFRDAFVRQGDIEARFLPLLLLAIAEAAALAHALFLFLNGQLDVGQVVAYFGLIQLFRFPTFVSLFAFSQVSLGMASANRILGLINLETNLDQNVRGTNIPMRGEIEFKNVSFKYNNEEPVLENITFNVSQGQTVAIVGQTGSGKTTLVKLVNRTYDITGGKVLVEGVDVRDWNLEALRQNISIIEQDIFLFSRKLSENISFGQPSANEIQIKEASLAAQADGFIDNFQYGYDTVIGERGVTLSGGQRQRIALARAFLTDPRILILDDSTSAIDSATEDKIQRAIYAAARGRTTLIITHRLSQIRWADLIIVLRKGKIAAKGTHEELLQTSNAYRRIFKD